MHRDGQAQRFQTLGDQVAGVIDILGTPAFAAGKCGDQFPSVIKGYLLNY